MKLQKIIESLLRARLYRTPVVIRVENGQERRGVVREVRYEGSRSTVVVADALVPGREHAVPLSAIRRVDTRARATGTDAVA